MIKKLLYLTGIFCFLCAFGPLLYGIFNAGVAAFLAVGAGIIVLTRYWGKIRGIIPLKRFVTIILILCISYAAISSALMAKQAYFHNPPDSGEMTLVVLGGGIVGDQPSLMLRRRLNAAYRYMVKNPEAMCVVTGGQAADEEYPESVVMKNYLVSLGINSDRVIVEDKSTNTRENLGFAAELTSGQDTPATVVTDGFHQYRASMYAQEAGFHPPYGISAVTPWGLLPTYWAREMLAIGAALVNIHLGGGI